MTASSDLPAEAEETVGKVLARLRKGKRLTGGELARKVGMSQPKISRLERDVGLPDPADVARLAQALGADEDLVRQLVDRAESQHNRMADWRLTPVALAARQRSMAEWEAATQTYRSFESAVVTGLLQTSGYATAILASFQRVISRDEQPDEAALLEAVSERIRRQQVLADDSKAFHFVLTEAVLRNRLCPPAEMLAQIEKIRELAERTHVSIKIIPDEASWDIAPMHGFTMLDERLVIVDLYNTGLTARGRNDAERYRHIFEAFQEAAEEDIGPLLDKYKLVYIERLRRPTPELRGNHRVVDAGQA